MFNVMLPNSDSFNLLTVYFDPGSKLTAFTFAISSLSMLKKKKHIHRLFNKILNSQYKNIFPEQFIIYKISFVSVLICT